MRKISKLSLRRMIREEKRRIQEDCGMASDAAAAPELPAMVPALDVVTESEDPSADMLIEMEVASRAMEQVVESAQNAAQLCPNCGPAIAAQAPILEAMVTQVEALQEMLEAQTAVLEENADTEISLDLQV